MNKFIKDIEMENDKQTKKEFSDALFIVARNFRVELEAPDYNYIFKFLKDYSIEQIKKGFRWLIYNRKATYPAMPTIGEIVDAIEKANGSYDIEIKGKEQFDIIMKYFNFYGRYCDHKFKDPITRYLMENRWSFYNLGNMMADDLKWFKKEFVADYEEISKKEHLNNRIENKQENLKVTAGKLKKLIQNKDHLKIVPIRKVR